MEGVGDLMLSFNYPARAGLAAVKKTLRMPLVVDIERNVNVNLTEMGTIIYGCRNNFCMDLGATEKVTFKCERVNPFPYSDMSSDPDDWSNGKWYRHLEDLFDRWQNFGLDSKGEQTGGCTMVFTPADASLMAPISGNVFLVGALGVSYSVQKMTFSLPLQFGNMKMTSSEAERVTLTLVTETFDKKTETTTVSVLKGYPQSVPLPDEWADIMGGAVFIGWEVSNGAYVPVGSTYTYQTEMTLTARWRKASSVQYITSDETVTVPSGVDHVSVYAVGGGGGAGGSARFIELGNQEYVMAPGGAGGAGQTSTASWGVSAGDVISVTIGAGGECGASRGALSAGDGGDGKNGGKTVVKCRYNICTAEGGSGGGGTKNMGGAGKGGEEYVAGGSYEQDGGYEAPNVKENRGKKGTRGTAPSPSGLANVLRYGGGGGGAAAFRYAFIAEDGTRYPASGYYESIGGDGADEADPQVRAYSGKVGGGGGSGRAESYLVDKERAGYGGDGAVILAFFKVSG